MASPRRSRKASTHKKATVEPPERRQHAKLEDVPTDTAGVKARRVKPVVETLSARGTIDGRQLAAAEALREDYEVGIHGARIGDDLPVGVQGKTGDRHEMTQAQIEAAANYRRAVQTIGLLADAVVTPIVLENCTLEETGRRLGVDKKHLAGRLQVALDQVASFYGL